MSLTEAIPNVREVKEILKKCWKKNTAYTKNIENGYDRPSRGQCYVTAVLIRELFGGEIMTGIVEKVAMWINAKGKVEKKLEWTERHYWNRINGIEIDFTSDQYGGDGYHPLAGIRGTVSKIKGTSNSRYKILRKCWDEYEKEAFIW